MKTKKEIKDRCSEILISNRGKQITGDDYNFMMRVFKYHPEYSWYTENGGNTTPTLWSKRNADHDFKADSFVVVYPNKFESSFSFRKCITNAPKHEISTI